MAANRILKVTGGGEVRFLEATANGQHYVALKANASLAGSTTYTLPTADGAAGTVLSTAGDGTLSWASLLASLTVTTLTVGTLKATDNGVIELYEAVGNGTEKITVQAPASLGADWTLTLPPDKGTVGYVLRTDGNGVATWTNALPALTVDAVTSISVSLRDDGGAKLYFYETGDTYYTTFTAGAQSVNIDYTLPTAIVADGYLKVAAGGALSWTTSTASLQSAYDDAEDITMSAGNTIDISQANNENMLYLNKTGTGTGNCLWVQDAGTGYGVYVGKTGGGDGLYVSKSAAGNAIDIYCGSTSDTAIEVTQAADSIGLSIDKTGTGAGNLIDLTNSGTGYDIEGNANSWHVRKGGGIKCTGLIGTWANHTISSAAITVDADDFLITLEPETGTSDTWTTITGGTDGQVLIVTLKDTGDTITVTNSSAGGDNICMPTSRTLDSSGTDVLTLVYHAARSRWVEISHAANTTA